MLACSNGDSVWHYLTSLLSPCPTPEQVKAQEFIDSRLRQYSVVLFVENSTEEFGCVVADVVRRSRRVSRCIVNLDQIEHSEILREIQVVLEEKSGSWSLPVLFLNGQCVPQIGAIRDA
ncbi:hypothetical protein H310_05565 [Aphanomyces invadans]|uniref:Uncharacterized protein n=1 Tax=Aphanomyces invadans TaxID=157072 RepID=A0A024UB66_9STRA|nr:hypothetical protein H310_05565 [Aphanomyces invadans]ETW03147.1 hypothetical protein H310_05565 [Aphanomyces invadans]|eukprot:XP_008868531.1 hypothetical protein H310_05565 [Aphanomyces invadans]